MYMQTQIIFIQNYCDFYKISFKKVFSLINPVENLSLNKSFHHFIGDKVSHILQDCHMNRVFTVIILVTLF
jgi:hypothetical protein